MIKDGEQVNKAYVDSRIAKLTVSLLNGDLAIPQALSSLLNFAGGANYCPDSDFNYSKDAVTVQGTTPGSAGDGNYEAYRWHYQKVGDPIGSALIASGHSGYGALPANAPDWDRTQGWARLGSTDEANQYDIAVQLLQKWIKPGKTWYVRPRFVSLTNDLLPVNVQFGAGIWVKNGGTQGYAKGGAFTLSYAIHGLPGSASTQYRVLAKTDGGAAVLSDVLTIATAPDVLGSNDYPTIFYNAGPGFIEFEIHRHREGVYHKLFTVRNTVTFQYNDTGELSQAQVENGWPGVPLNAPIAYNQKRVFTIPGYGQTWAPQTVIVSVPSTYDSSPTDADGQYLRLTLTAPTGANRQVGIDEIWFSTTLNEWAPDQLPRFADGSYPAVSVSQTSSNQGGGGGVGPPPNESGDPGGRGFLPL